MRTPLFILAVVISAIFSMPSLATAQSGGSGVSVPPASGNSGGFGVAMPPTLSNTGSNVTLVNPLKSGTSLESFLGNILQFVIRIGTIVVILMVVFVGYKFVVAQGAPGKIEEARDMLLWTVIGALVLLGAQAIAIGIQATVRALGG